MLSNYQWRMLSNIAPVIYFPQIPSAKLFAQIWQFLLEGFEISCGFIVGKYFTKALMYYLNTSHVMLIWCFTVVASYFLCNIFCKAPDSCLSKHTCVWVGTRLITIMIVIKYF